MILSNAAKAYVEEEKITEYLLSTTHPEGKSKAAFFMSFGYSSDKWQVLADDLVKHANQYEIAKITETPYGTKYGIVGKIQTPDGRNPTVYSVWIIEDERSPRLVTAYPG